MDMLKWETTSEGLLSLIEPTSESENLPTMFGVPRDSKWEAKRNHWIMFVQPCCQACSSKKYLTVHHKKPFHEFPELELDESNFVTLCENPTFNCHFYFGHKKNWRLYNPSIDETLKVIQTMFAQK